MRMQFFTIPTREPAEAMEELNKFLATHRISDEDSQFVSDGPNSFWSVRVTWLEGAASAESTKRKTRIDYREVLSESDFRISARLRELRKTWSEQEGVPAYNLFNNEQLAAMVTSRVSSVSDLNRISGIGDARIQKYGEKFVDMLKSEWKAMQETEPPA